jgi:hypothetical protein
MAVRKTGSLCVFVVQLRSCCVATPENFSSMVALDTRHSLPGDGCCGSGGGRWLRRVCKTACHMRRPVMLLSVAVNNTLLLLLLVLLLYGASGCCDGC